MAHLYTSSWEDGTITCEICGRTSHSADDVVQRYCGYCGLFLDELERELIVPAVECAKSLRLAGCAGSVDVIIQTRGNVAKAHVSSLQPELVRILSAEEVVSTPRVSAKPVRLPRSTLIVP